MTDTFTVAGPKPGTTVSGYEWTSENLCEIRDSVEEQDDVPVTLSTVFKPEYVGRVTEARYDDHHGLVFEIVIEDPEIANQIDDGLVDVAPIVVVDDETEDGELSNLTFDRASVYNNIQDDCFGVIDPNSTGTIDDYDSFIEDG